MCGDPGGREQRDVALPLWRAELAARLRTRETFDGLFRAACLECEAHDWERDRVPYVAERCRAEAARVIIAAVAELIPTAGVAGRAA